MSAYIKKIDNVEPYPLMPQNFKCDSSQRSSPFWAQIVNDGKGFFPAYSMLTVVPSGSSKNLMKHCNPFQLTKQMQAKFTQYMKYFFKLSDLVLSSTIISSFFKIIIQSTCFLRFQLMTTTPINCINDWHVKINYNIFRLAMIR